MITKVGFLGSRPLASKILEWLSKQKNIEIIGVVAPKFKGWWDIRLGDTVRKLKIPLLSYKNLFKKKPDLVVSVNYWRIIKKLGLGIPKLGIVNIHHSYKLRFRGRFSCSYARLHARKDGYWKHGTTLHYIDKKLDQGRIIATDYFIIKERDSAWNLYQKADKLAYKLFVNNFKKIIENRVKIKKPSKKNYFYTTKDLNKEMKKGWSKKQKYDFIKAWTFPNSESPYIVGGDKKVYIKNRRNLVK